MLSIGIKARLSAVTFGNDLLMHKLGDGTIYFSNNFERHRFGLVMMVKRIKSFN